MNETLLRIEAPHFCAGCALVNGRVIKAAPILAYMKGWTEDAVRVYAIKKHWTVKVVNMELDMQRRYSATSDGRVTPVVVHAPKSSSATSS